MKSVFTIGLLFLTICLFLVFSGCSLYESEDKVEKVIRVRERKIEKAPLSSIIYDYREDTTIEPEFILYNLHGQCGNEHSWELTMEHYTNLFYTKNIVVISPLLGPEGMFLPNVNDKSNDHGVFFIEDFIPSIETENNWTKSKRIIMGYSIGGTSASYLFFNHPEYFYSALLLSSGIYPIPFNSSDKEIMHFLDTYGKYTFKERVKMIIRGEENYFNQVKYLLSIQSRYIPSRDTWERYNVFNTMKSTT